MCQNNIDNVQYNGEFETKFGLSFRCSECIVECINKETHHTDHFFHSDSKSDNDVSYVKDKSYPNDDHSNFVIVNENSKEVEELVHDDNDIIISDNNEDENEDIIFEKLNIAQKMSVSSFVCEAHFSKLICIYLRIY